MSDSTLLLSVRPEYAEKIFEGIKTVELRRTRPRLCEGDVVIVYASSPTKALIGAFEVEKVIQKPLKDLWHEVQKKAGISYDDFCCYYEGVSVGCGIFLDKPCSFNEPIKLDRLRQESNNFRPPQSYRYLKPNELDLVEKIAKFDMSKFSRFYQTTLAIT
jgi:predicted transcriptional regulator